MISYRRKSEEKLNIMECPPAKIYGEVKIASKRYLRKIEFEGHMYIHLCNDWNGSSDNLIHDPDCVCMKNKKDKAYNNE